MLLGVKMETISFVSLVYVHKHLYYANIFFIVLTMFLAQNIL